MSRPKPCSLQDRLSSDSVEYLKKVWCGHYAECLDTAIRENWQQFSCRDCHAFVCVREAFDIQPIVRLLMAIFPRSNVVLVAKKCV